MDPADIDNRFRYHPANTEQKRNEHEAIRESCRQLAHAIDGLLPEGREKSLAITNLEQVMFWGNAGLARTPS